jgi:hypothetical protein
MRMDIDEAGGGGVSSMTWKAIGAAIAVLLIWWFLLR